jgi:predicted transcriptional regulator
VEYRTRYKLDPDYPMVAPSYSDARRAMAKSIGLGRKTIKEIYNPSQAKSKNPRRRHTSNISGKNISP